MRKNSKRAAVVATVAAVAVGGLGVSAWAAGWFAEGTATGTAQSSDIKPLSATLALNGKIFPGAQLTATATIANPNEFKVALNKAEAPTFTVKHTASQQPNPECQSKLSAAVIKIGGMGGTNVINAKTTNQQITLPVTVDDIDQKCAGSDITMTMKFGGTSTV